MAACHELMSLPDGLEDAVEGVLPPADEGDEAHGAGGLVGVEKWTALRATAFSIVSRVE